MSNAGVSIKRDIISSSAVMAVGILRPCFSSHPKTDPVVIMKLTPSRGLTWKHVGYKVYIFEEDSIKALKHNQF